jgi:hypothetical protein
MPWPFKTTVRYVQEHKTVRIQYAVCADNVGSARRELLRRFTEQHVDGYEIENVVAVTGQEAARLNLTTAWFCWHSPTTPYEKPQPALPL